jgi:DNA polymerase-3 subunit alpha
VYRKEREESYVNARFVARERPSYPHPAMAAVLDPTFGHILYADQLVDLVKLLDLDHAWAERFRRAIAIGPSSGRDVMERAIREAGARLGWSTAQSNALIALLVEHVGYVHLHGHALTMAQHVFRQACLKVNPLTAPRFFAEVLNNGGSVQYGLGSAVEEARRFGVLLLPPCVNRSSERFCVEEKEKEDNDESAPAAEGRGAIGAIRVPLTAIRGLGPRAAQHILAARCAFGTYTSLLDFCRKVDQRLVSRHDLILLIKLGAFNFTGLSRSQLAAAEQYYTSLADTLRSSDGDPADVGTLEDELGSGALRFVPSAEWSPETIAAYELAHLGFYTASPFEVGRHARRLTEEFGVTSIAELVDYPDRTPASVGAVVTNLRLRLTRKGEKMAWLTLADATGAIEAAVFPQAFARIADAPGGDSPLREGAFLVARGRLNQEEATGSKLFIDEIVRLHPGAWRSALLVALEESADVWEATDLGRAS